MKSNARKQKNKIRFLYVLAIAILLIISLMIKDKYEAQKDAQNEEGESMLDAAVFYTAVFNKYTCISKVYMNGEEIAQINGRAVVHTNMNQDVFYLETDEYVYYIDGNILVKIEEKLDFLAIANHSKEVLAAGMEGGIYLINKSEYKRISEDITDYAVISGDGKTWAYNVGSDAYIIDDGKALVKVSDTFITYMSDNGGLIYGISYGEEQVCEFKKYYSEQVIALNESDSYMKQNVEYELVLIKRDGTKKIVDSEIMGFNGLSFDGNELMYYKDMSTYIVVGGMDCKKLIGKRAYPYDVAGKKNDDVARYGFRNIDSYIGGYIATDGKLYLINNDYEAEILVDDCWEVMDVTDDLSKVLYINANYQLYALQTGESMNISMICESAGMAVISSDGKDAYCIYVAEDGCYLQYAKNFCNPRSVFNIPDIGSNTTLTRLGNDIYVGKNKVWYVEEGYVKRVKSLAYRNGAKDYRFVTDAPGENGYIIYDYELYTLDEYNVMDSKGEVVESLPDTRQVTNDDKLGQIEYEFKIDLPENAELKYYKFIDKDSHYGNKYMNGDYLLAEVILVKSDYDRILEYYETNYCNMKKYSDENWEYILPAWSDRCIVVEGEEQIEHWYSLDSKYDEGEKMPIDDIIFSSFYIPGMSLLEYEKYFENRNVLITEIINGEFHMFFAVNVNL